MTSERYKILHQTHTEELSINPHKRQMPGALHSDTLVRRLHASIKGERRAGGLVAALALVVHPPRHREQRRRLASHWPPLSLSARLHSTCQAVLQFRPELREICRQRAPQVALGKQQVGSRHELQRRLRLDQAEVLLQDRLPAEKQPVQDHTSALIGAAPATLQGPVRLYACMHIHWRGTGWCREVAMAGTHAASHLMCPAGMPVPYFGTYHTAHLTECSHA